MKKYYNKSYRIKHSNKKIFHALRITKNNRDHTIQIIHGKLHLQLL